MMNNVREKLMELLEQNEIGFMTYSTDKVIAAAIGDDPIDRFLSRVVFTADFLLSNGVTIQEWIPVSEPPKENGRYYVHVKMHDISYVKIATFSKESVAGLHDNCWYEYDSDVGFYEVTDVTHWMPLPAPPKGE